MNTPFHLSFLVARLLRGSAFVLGSLLLGAVILLAQPPASTHSSGAQATPSPLSVAVGKSMILDSAQPVKRVAIGAPEMAEATAISRNEILINGKAAGETSLIVWTVDGGRRFYNLTVSSNLLIDRQEGIRRQLAIELPGQGVQLTAEGDTTFLRGTVKDLNSSERAERIARGDD